MTVVNVAVTTAGRNARNLSQLFAGLSGLLCLLGGFAGEAARAGPVPRSAPAPPAAPHSRASGRVDVAFTRLLPRECSIHAIPRGAGAGREVYGRLVGR